MGRVVLTIDTSSSSYSRLNSAVDDLLAHVDKYGDISRMMGKGSWVDVYDNDPLLKKIAKLSEKSRGILGGTGERLR